MAYWQMLAVINLLLEVVHNRTPLHAVQNAVYNCTYLLKSVNNGTLYTVAMACSGTRVVAHYCSKW